MRASIETYKNVAENCSAFTAINEETTFKSMYNEGGSVSCTNCKHFTNDSHCELDLFDKVVKNHNFQ